MVTMEGDSTTNLLINFLQEELALSPAAISVARKHSETSCGPLPMVLWKLGMISLHQLQQIFDWLGY
ncbi:MAG: DUF2949 domain-containing protein [Trichodesmium sp. St18_bin3_1_1]|nr:DUF2949 domain-containing protein [Trichodesmium sp. St18_bin3_1_1]MDE5092701.1 DUF2949 domain-containing protein [Trichodesmium sp. St11_bin5]MDT9339503.1 DUF2949 domain-containing protein [Trichodesmium erythraeum 21-75]